MTSEKALARQMYEAECEGGGFRPTWDTEPAYVRLRYEGYATTALQALSPRPDQVESQSAGEAVEVLRKFADFKNCTAADVHRARELCGMLHLNDTDGFATTPAKEPGHDE